MLRQLLLLSIAPHISKEHLPGAIGGVAINNVKSSSGYYSFLSVPHVALFSPVIYVCMYV